jgi:predicted nucleotidyltransferase
MSGSSLTRDEILEALGTLSGRLGERGTNGEICIFGGAVMVLVFNARVTTKDVDAIFQPATIVRELVRDIAETQGLPADWLNDGVKGFTSSRADFTAGNLPQFPHLRVTMPVPEYLLAMKCMAARIGTAEGEASDVRDIVFLIRHLGLKSARDVLELLTLYYPKERITVKTQYLIEGLFDEGKV